MSDDWDELAALCAYCSRKIWQLYTFWPGLIKIS